MSRHQLVSICLLTCMLGGYWFLMAKGELAEIDGLEAQIRNLHATQSLSELEAERFDEYQESADEAQGWLDRLEEVHAMEGSASDLLLHVDAELTACGLTALKSVPAGVLEHELLREQSLELLVECDPQSLLEFLRRMEASRPFCRVTELRVDPGMTDGSVRANMVLTRLWREV